MQKCILSTLAPEMSYAAKITLLQYNIHMRHHTAVHKKRTDTGAVCPSEPKADAIGPARNQLCETGARESLKQTL